MSIKSLIKRAFVSLSRPDNGNYPITQVSYLGKTADMQTIWPYGMFGRLPVNAEVFLFNIEGMEENKAGIGGVPTLRTKVDAEGEVGFGNPLTGAYVKFLADNSIEMTNGEGTFISEPNGDFNINGVIITKAGEITNAAGIVLGTHTHAQGPDSDGDTQVNVGAPL